MLAVLLSACAGDCGGADAPLPRLAQVPPFQLTSQDGDVFDSGNLRGRVWVAGFIFTSCPSVCPMITAQMANLQRRVDDDRFRLVSFSVDPENDTPEVLRRYAALHGADLERWVFLTGERATLRQVIVDGLKMRMGERTPTGDIAHGSHLVLVDGDGRIRGFYRTDREGLDALERDARRLLAELP